MSFSSHNFPLPGSLLLASPLLNDGVFDHAVILITHYDPETGASGMILNKPSEHTLGKAATKSNLPKELSNINVFFGGPVEPDTLVFMAFSRKNGEFSYSSHLSMEKAASLTKQPGTIVKAFSGHSGWVKRQLENELDQFTWIRAKTAPELLDFSYDKEMWKGILRQISPYHAILAEAPQKPYLN